MVIASRQEARSKKQGARCKRQEARCKMQDAGARGRTASVMQPASCTRRFDGAKKGKTKKETKEKSRPYANADERSVRKPLTSVQSHTLEKALSSVVVCARSHRARLHSTQARTRVSSEYTDIVHVAQDREGRGGQRRIRAAMLLPRRSNPQFAADFRFLAAKPRPGPRSRHPSLRFVSPFRPFAEDKAIIEVLADPSSWH